MMQTLLTEAHDELKMSELLGYGDKKAFNPMHELINEIERKWLAVKVGLIPLSNSGQNYLLQTNSNSIIAISF